jgi:hypothetical protein
MPRLTFQEAEKVSQRAIDESEDIVEVLHHEGIPASGFSEEGSY